MTKGPDFLPMPEPGEPPTVTRSAPTPSGYLHLGHAYSALVAWEAARAVGGRFSCAWRTSIASACRPEFEQGICDDLRWLGSIGTARWCASLTGWTCTIRRSASLIASACSIRASVPPAHPGRDRPRRPGAPWTRRRGGLSRHLPEPRRQRAPAPDRGRRAFALRLDVGRALELTGPLTWRDARAGECGRDRKGSATWCWRARTSRPATTWP